MASIQIPIEIDNLPLSPEAYRLYAKILRDVQQNGYCEETTRELASHCRIATGTVSRAKRELERMSLIEIEEIYTYELGFGFGYKRHVIRTIPEQDIPV